jgi:sugar lactone lactonase YvrE
MIEFSPSRNANILAVLAILGIVATLLTIWEAGRDVLVASGPSALAADADGNVFFIAGQTLYRADAQGALLQTIPLESLGLGPAVTRLAVLGDDLLLAEAEGGRLHRCNRDLGSCSLLTTVPVPGPGGLLALAAAPDAQRLYVAEGAGHAVHALSIDGAPLYRLGIEGGLSFPNHLAWLGDGHLLVADTNRHRVIVLQDLGDGRTVLREQLDVQNAPGREDHIWPIRAVRDDQGRTWVINGDGFLRDGDLIVYGADGMERQRIGLDDGADPTALALLPDSLLLADRGSYQLLRIGLTEHRVSAFGDASLREALDGLQSRHALAQQRRHVGIITMILFGLLAALALHLDRRARRVPAPGQRRPGDALRPAATNRAHASSSPAQGTPIPDPAGMIWLTVKPGVLRSVRIALGLMTAGAAMVPIAFLPFDDTPWDVVGLIALPILLVVATGWWMLGAFKRLRIGTDGRELHVVDLFGREGRAVPEEFVYTGSRLLLGRIAIPVANPNGSLFDREAFEANIAPLLERTPRGNEMAVLWANLRRGDPIAWGGVVLVVVVIGLQLWFGF